MAAKYAAPHGAATRRLDGNRVTFIATPDGEVIAYDEYVESLADQNLQGEIEVRRFADVASRGQPDAA